ncbi:MULTISPECIES: spore germination protein [unclassified Paenibacillus]|uniref:spore germination protein n=1 Tax=unclassified Paenibacillus TaxID=185978 RepID=UPI00362EAE53
MREESTASEQHVLAARLDLNIEEIQDRFGRSQDLVVKEMTYGTTDIALVYIDGLVDTHVLNQSIIASLLNGDKYSSSLPSYSTPANLLDFFKEEVLSIGDIGQLKEMSCLFNSLLSGDVVLLAEGHAGGLHIGAAGWEDRNVGEPTTQTVIRGPMEAFTENIRTNTALIRRKIKDPQLWLEGRQIGTVTKTNVAVMYMRQIADESLVQEVFSRLDKINIDSILESGYIEEFIQDKTWTPFPTVYNSERPDTIAAGLLEGKVAIIVDGTPFVLLVPALFVQFFQSAEDYYQRADVSSLLRLMRFMAFFITMLSPSLYIAVTTFHQEMLPTNLLINLAAQREGVPFPAFIEALMMEVTFEILREAGVRMPKTVGQAVSIVGTLVIGQSAVEAGIVSAVMVIIVAITAISSFVIPAAGMSISIRMIRFILMGLAASFGLIGIMVGLLLLIIHLSCLRSFGVPFLSSLSPFHGKDQKDTLFRLPWPLMTTRPMSTAKENLWRQPKTPKPKT